MAIPRVSRRGTGAPPRRMTHTEQMEEESAIKKRDRALEKFNTPKDFRGMAPPSKKFTPQTIPTPTPRPKRRKK